MNRDRSLSAAGRRHLACSLMLALLALSLAGRHARADGAADQKRAAEVAQVVLGIISYVRWPAPAPTPAADIQICLAGDTKYADALAETAAPGGNLHIRTLRLSRRIRCGAATR